MQHKFLMFFLAGTRRDKINVEKYDELFDGYKLKKLAKRRYAIDLSFFHSLVSMDKLIACLVLNCFPYGSDTSSADTQHRLVCLEQSACLCL